ncbi:class I SAM-dependent methyltransferase [Candidatus Ventrimonas sp. KK005]
MNQITKKMKDHHFEIFEKFGANVQGVDWGKAMDEDKLELRYSKMLELISRGNEMNNNPSILDVGCGFGGLYQYALKKGYSFDYTGIDVCENMIDYALKNNENGTFICGDIFEYEPNKNYDFLICNGILTQKLDTNIRKMDEHAIKLINKMWDLSNIGIVFNLMKSQVDFMVDHLYYKSPLEVMGYCMTLTDKFIIDSSYPLYEYSVYLYKN